MRPSDFTEACIKNDMPSKDYSPIANRFMQDTKLLRLTHTAIGMAGEAGELLDTIKKSMMYGKTLDINNLKEECGDLLWYMAIMLDGIGSSFEEIMQKNVDKLAIRYPNGFTEQNAIDRVDKKS